MLETVIGYDGMKRFFWKGQGYRVSLQKCFVVLRVRRCIAIDSNNAGICELGWEAPFVAAQIQDQALGSKRLEKLLHLPQLSSGVCRRRLQPPMPAPTS